ncbi:MAG: glycoside hydrolase family 15 protein [Solirubrobacteraceae bacterium]
MSRAADYPDIGDFALISDCHTSALISRSGSIEWCCLPRFDSSSTFARILDRERGGCCELAPAAKGARATRSYEDDSLVLATTWSAGGARAHVLDMLSMSDECDSERRLLRIVEGDRGEVEMKLRLAPRFDYGELPPWIRKEGVRSWSAIGGDDGLVISCDAELAADTSGHELEATFSVRAGERVRLVIAYRRPEMIDAERPEAADPEMVDSWARDTARWWKRWRERLSVGGSDAAGARRSTLVLKGLTYRPTGAMVAAPTTSLPEAPGASRNWDYRYSWIRDSSFASRTLAEVGAFEEADAFRRFTQRSAAGRAEDVQILYGVGGERRLAEQDLDRLEGYRGALPVRAGNAASGQLQLDAIGEIVNLFWRWHQRGHSPDDDQWRFLLSLVDAAAEKWSDPDQGLWEWRGAPEHFVHSKVLCWSALDRGLRLAEECLRRAPSRRWTAARREVREAIESDGYDAERNTFLQAFGHDYLDAALLLLPSVGFVAWEDPRMVGTVDAIREELDAGGGLLYRYRRDDGLDGDEGAFVACSFWLVECLARQGRHDEARSVFDAAAATGNDLGLFSEEWDVDAGRMLGNFPQALTHLAHIAACLALSETREPGEA